MNIIERKANFERQRIKFSNQTHEITTHYMRGYLDYINYDPLIREAHAHYEYYNNVQIFLFNDEELVGYLPIYEPVMFIYGSGTDINERLVLEYIKQENYSNNEEEEFLSNLALIREQRYVAANPKIYNDAEMKSIKAIAATSTWFGGHMILDYQRILDIGLNGYREEINRCKIYNEEKHDFYDALTVLLDGIEIYIIRCAKALVLAGNESLAKILYHISSKPPETFHQALQLYWMMHMLNGMDTFGRADYLLDKFYVHDIANGILTHKRAEELICELMLKVELVEQIQNMTVGGTDDDGNDFYVELTEIIIAMISKLKYKGPNLCLRITETMPKRIWETSLSCIATGIGLPALYNDCIYVDNLTRSGIPIEDARGYSLAGCSQVMIPGKCNFYNDIGILNAGKIAEIATYGGYDNGELIGAETTSIAQTESFQDVLDAFYKQLEHFVDIEVSIHEKEIVYRASCEGYAMRTLFIQDCLSKGLNIFKGGAKYNNIELEIIGITNCADHLYTIKKLVFDDGYCTLPQLVDAMKNNYKNHENLRRHIKNNIPKFGNDIKEVDDLRADITKYLYNAFNVKNALFGGVYVPGEVIFTAHEWCGAATGATADGRLSGEVMADSAGASQGVDKNGPTSLMNSVLKLPVGEYLLTSTALNIRFLPKLFESEYSRNAIELLFKSFFTQGGMQLQINVVDAKILQEAKNNPEKYSSLVVRVGGYSDYFTRLSDALQNDIITRTAQVFG